MVVCYAHGAHLHAVLVAIEGEALHLQRVVPRIRLHLHCIQLLTYVDTTGADAVLLSCCRQDQSQLELRDIGLVYIWCGSVATHTLAPSHPLHV